jgi:extracellular elastinolytic metalloproteinase
MVNAFYICNFMHDFFYLLGFDESKLNFQDANLPGIGKGGDPVAVRVVDERNDSKPASFFNKLDGSSPELKLRAVGPNKLLTALDADIVMHEYVHGVTDRMVGDGSDERPFREEESVALAEGICDYYALSIQNWYRREVGDELQWTLGAWVTQRPNGLRARAYGDDFDLTYGSLTTFDASKAHDAGQVWAQTLFELNAGLSFDDSEAEGDLRGWQTVFNSLAPLHPQLKGPHFLHARDAILAEVRRMAPTWRIDPDRAEKAVWGVFGRRGMGPSASSPEARFKFIKEHVTP